LTDTRVSLDFWVIQTFNGLSDGALLFLLVEQNLPMAAAVADRVTC
jgi:ABC-type branched-subunit amino acid transport system ATPase component